MQAWYIVHTKVRQEQIAFDNLQRQSFECFLPRIRVEKIRRGKVALVDEPLFPRYLFIRLSADRDAPSWGPIRSTLGVSRLVSFGQTPARIADEIVDGIREECASRAIEQRHFTPGEKVQVTQGAFAGLEAIFETIDADGRVMLLLEMLSKPVKLAVSPAEVTSLS